MYGLGISNCRSSADVVTGVREAEDMGAGIVFVAEDVNCRDAFELCALCASQTTRVTISTGVVNPYTRNPTSLAMAVATLDEISGGRAALGLGTSSPSLIDEQMGIQSGNTIVVMREATAIIRKLLAGDSVTFAGERFRYANARLTIKPVQTEIPIFFAAMGPQMLRLAGHMADGVLLNVGASPEYVRWAVGQVRRGEEMAGRDHGAVTIAAWMNAYVGDDLATGLQRAREWLATMLSIPRQGELLLQHAGLDASILSDIRKRVRAYPHGGDRLAASEYVPTEVASTLALVGTASAVRARLDEYRAAGVDIPVLGISAMRALFGAARADE